MSGSDEKLVEVVVNGVPMKARAGQMIIELTDRHDVYVPRFCYHRKLSIAANCRMCLVDVEKAPKPLPACATPVTEGMKIFTRSARAISAQKATMEFLLINHPLDCPICDQGGECELQDLAMGFGRGVSRYTERKRVVKDKNLGPLVSTDMTRCIHCTRCVRFGQEIAGLPELGAVGRGEDMEIGTYIEKSVDHELSGNIIDLCPVGALNNKPYRFSARAWEMIEKPLIAPHDCAGSNLSAHVLRGELRRIVPGENDAINETWISDRDRFSCFGLYAEDRLARPMIKRDQQWFEVSWQEAIDHAAKGLKAAVGDESEAVGVLASPSATLEELYLLKKLARNLGSRSIDYRLRRVDFRDQANDPAWPWLGTDIAAIAGLEGILVVGSNLRMEAPIIAHHVRKAALAGAAVGFVNPADYPMCFSRKAHVEAPAGELPRALAGVLVAALESTGGSLSPALAEHFGDLEPTPEQKSAACVLLEKGDALVLLGQLVERHPRLTELRYVAAELAAATGARLGFLSEGANAAGAALVGFVPRRDGARKDGGGLDVEKMLSAPRHAYIVHGIEPDADIARSELAEAALKSADIVVALTAFAGESLLDCADVVLPIATFAETAGTFVNAEGRWQSFSAATDAYGDSRPAWRVLRVLATELGAEDCAYGDIGEIQAELGASLEKAGGSNAYDASPQLDFGPVDVDLDSLDVPAYSIDPLVRRSQPLQQTTAALERAEGLAFDRRSAG
ncbi:MAG TPA: NADH-quinone oxidoreductase subunit NuoG [Gammaproteobacteria bacterium]|nr:NADH-quinone oxidoreductase subunit NuoG [Gammaproteobacteria bacterium]